MGISYRMDTVLLTVFVQSFSEALRSSPLSCPVFCSIIGTQRLRLVEYCGMGRRIEALPSVWKVTIAKKVLQRLGELVGVSSICTDGGLPR